MTAAEPLDLVRDALSDAGCNPTGREQMAALCPSHSDSRPSLSVGRGDRAEVVVNCHAGCDSADVLESLGLTWKDLSRANGSSDDQPIRVYDYTDANGVIIGRVGRYSPKTFRPVRRDGDRWVPTKGMPSPRPLYRLGSVVDATNAGAAVFVAEGEKDADRLTREGVTSTTWAHGTASWSKTDWSPLSGATVSLIADRDEAGRRAAQEVSAHLAGLGATVEILEAREGNDVSDHLDAGFGVDDLVPADLEADDAEGDEAVGHLLGLRPVADIAAEVDAAPPPGWLFSRVWPADAHGVVAAKWKAGKTWLQLDAAVAVASGGRWLDHFEVDAPGPVILFLGEGGARKMTRRGRAVAAARGVVWDDLPIRMAERVPHLADAAQVDALSVELDREPAALVIIDPLYLAVGGADARQLYSMGEVLEPVQVACQRAGAALMLVHHNNRDASRKGSARMSGAGPAEWGRVLVSVDVLSSRVDDGGVSDVVLALDFEGDEITGGRHQFRRRVWTDDPDDLASAMHYEVTPVETLVDAAMSGPASGLAPSCRRVLDVLDAEDWSSVKDIGDRLADKGHPLKKRTIQDALKELRATELAEPFGDDRGMSWSWRATS